MDSDLKHQLRIAILRALDAAHPLKLSRDRLSQSLTIAQIPVDTLDSELADLASLGLVDSVPNPLMAEILSYTRTEKARVHLAGLGF